MSEWTPTPQAYRGPADPENGPRRLAERLADGARQMRESLNHLLQAAGIKVETGLLRILGALQSDDFDGDLDADDPGTTGWAMNAQKAAFGSLILRPLSVGNEALEHAVGASASHATTGVTPVGTLALTPTNHAEVTFTVPSGFTAAAVMATSNITSIVRSHTCATYIAGVVGDYTECHPDEAGGSAYSRVLTGLSAGGTFTVGTQVMANASGGYVHAMTAAIVLFYR